jgi:hypothetical protein
MKNKTFPDSRHDKKRWSDLDKLWRVGLATTALRFQAILVYLKGDWAECAHTLGFPSWASKDFPCLFCDTTLTKMFGFRGISLLELPWKEHDSNRYFEACAHCELEVIIPDLDKLVALRSALHYDKRKHGFGGRAFVDDKVPTIISNKGPLQRGDRLEPSPYMSDVGLLDKVNTFPIILIFWRTFNETVCKHRNPIFDEELGIEPQRTLAIDPLHDIHLGVLQRYIIL